MKAQPGRFFIRPASQKVYRRKADDVRNGVAMRRMNTAVPFHGRHGRQERGKTFQYAFFPYRVFRALPQLYKSSHRRRHPAVTRCFPAPGRTVDMNRPLHHSHHRIVIVHQVGARDVAQPQPCMPYSSPSRSCPETNIPGRHCGLRKHASATWHTARKQRHTPT